MSVFRREVEDGGMGDRGADLCRNLQYDRYNGSDLNIKPDQIPS
jgi:hypothetical protein